MSKKNINTFPAFSHNSGYPQPLEKKIAKKPVAQGLQAIIKQNWIPGVVWTEVKWPLAAACWRDSRGLSSPPPAPSQDCGEACLALWNNGTKRPPRSCRNLFDRDCCCNESSSWNYFHLLPAQISLGPKSCVLPHRSPCWGLLLGSWKKRAGGGGGGGRTLTASFLRERVEGLARSGLGKRKAVAGKSLTSQSLPQVTDVWPWQRRLTAGLGISFLPRQYFLISLALANKLCVAHCTNQTPTHSPKKIIQLS